LAGYSVDEQKQIAKLFASKFIARSDVKAIQRSNGDYNPVEIDGVSVGFDMASLLNHINGVQTFGHYLLNQDDQCKLFVFDIDLNKPDKRYPDEKFYLPSGYDKDGVWADWVESNPREDWLDRSKTVQRHYMKIQLRLMAGMLAAQVSKQLEIPVAVAYTGSKGLHVYGFTGLMKAVDVRDGAQLILDSMGTFEPARGNHFFRHKLIPGNGDLDHELSFDCLTIEVFPKQVTLDRKTHGNLCRLPLGVNLKNPKDPTFFLDLRTNYGDAVFTPRNPIEALTVTDYWA